MILKSTRKNNLHKKIFFALSFSAFFSGAVLYAQNTTYDAGLSVSQDNIRSGEEGFAAEEFRRGVQAYYRGAFNESIVNFEKALSYLPNDNLILEWLGNAYYKSGMEGSALSYWQTAVNNGYGDLLLQNKIEIVRERRITGDSSEKLMRLSEAGSFDGNFNGEQIFNGPISVLTNNDGTFWITAYNSNELVKLNLNGVVQERITGPLLGGFDRPVDVIRVNLQFETNNNSKLKINGKDSTETVRKNYLLVSESAGDRLALLDEKGGFIKYIGSKGRGIGQFVGPQYLAQDSLGRIYVTDFGNRRVDVFDGDGKGLFFFGTKSNSSKNGYDNFSGFEGLKCPTGIAILGSSVDERIFVADEDKGCIYEFDRSGNYIRQLVENYTFKKPEAIKIYQNSLIVCDENRLVAVNPDTGALFEYAKTGNAPSRVTAACEDINRNLLVTDLTSNEVYVMSKLQELVGGLFVQIEKVDSSAFPKVVLEVKVENRHRQAIVGLQAENFYFTENKRPVSKLEFIGSVSNNNSADITIIVDRSKNCEKYQVEIERAIKEIAASMTGSATLRIVSAGSIPVTEYVGSPQSIVDSVSPMSALKNPTAGRVSTDLAIRLAANDLINGAKKRAIIMLSDGAVTDASFSRYNLAEVAAYLSNNSIEFSFVQLSQKALADEYNYLISNTSGDAYYVYRPEGLSDIVKNIIEIPQGSYQFSYVSSLPTNFGEKYLPVEAEVYMLNRSGRDERGYFAPLE
ncbi:MAG: VWA domain-containing protein [Treponema sp.]|nr:VWA domain-containing protein [Treponema sp.]